MDVGAESGTTSMAGAHVDTRRMDNAEVSQRAAARVVSLDVYRGLTIAGMILVTDPGSYSAVYWPLSHSQWNDPTPTDMIFPAFLFIVGMSLSFSFAARIERGADRRKLTLHLLRRSVMLVALGLALNGFPDYHWATLRLPGVLQRIGMCYLLAGLLYLVGDLSPLQADAVRRRDRRPLIAAVTVTLLAV
jgi:predicted acyltransferase